MSRIVVTGGAGFIGSHLVDRLIEDGHRVAVVDNLSTGSLLNLNGYAKFYEMSIEDKSLADVFDKEHPEFVFHLAAQISVNYSFENVVYDGNSNIIGSLNLLENCAKYGTKKIIFSSSAAVYGDVEQLPITEDVITKPLSPYGISKLTTESYIQLFAKNHDLEYIILRYANIFGPRQTVEGEAGVISVFLDKMIKGDQLTIHGDGSQTRDFVYVKDVVGANVASMESDVQGVFNVSGNSQISIKDLFYTIKEITGAQVGPRYEPSAPVGIVHSRLDNTRARDHLNFVTQFALQNALEETIAYFKQKELDKKIWLIMAAYNEGERIGKVLKALNAVTDNIVVVDDYSNDVTSEVVSQHRCHLLRHPINYGQGAALQAGMDYALKQGAKVLVHFDGDGQMQIKDIHSIAEPILNGEVDVTFGSRFLKNKDNVPFTKKWFIHKPAIYLNWMLTGMKMTDAHCGFRALSADAARKCVITQDRMAHATEILDLVRHHGLSYKEVPVDILYHEYGQSFKKGFRILFDLFSIKVIR